MMRMMWFGTPKISLCGICNRSCSDRLDATRGDGA
jgi:hypothetical protein